MPKKKKKSGGDIPEWVVTYGDLMSLLLCFFILLAAFSELKKPDEYIEVVDSIQEAFGVAGGVGRINMPTMNNQTMLNPVMERNRTFSGSEPSRADINRENVSGRDTTVNKIHEGTRFTVGASLLFAPGSAELSEQNKQLLIADVAPKIQDLNDVVVIRGHAWGEADLKGGMSLRELGYRRAEMVYEFLVREAGVRELILRIESVGAAEPRPSAGGTAEADPENRRVEVFRTEASIDELHPDPAGTGR